MSIAVIDKKLHEQEEEEKRSDSCSATLSPLSKNETNPWSAALRKSEKGVDSAMR